MDVRVSWINDSCRNARTNHPGVANALPLESQQYDPGLKLKALLQSLPRGEIGAGLHVQRRTLKSSA